MKRIHLLLLCFLLGIAVACKDKSKEEAAKKKALEAERARDNKIETVDKELNKDFENLEKEAREVNTALIELDNL